MSVTTLSSREFNQDVSRAKRAAESGPVVITDRGRPAFVLLSHEAYRRMVAPAANIRELLAQPDAAGDDFEFDPPRFGVDGIIRSPDWS